MKIASLYIYPVKGMRALALKEARVEPWGLADDRRWAVIDEDAKVVTQREQPLLATISAVPAEYGLVLSAAGAGSIRVAFPEEGDPITTRIFKDEVEARLAVGGASEWLSRRLGAPYRLVHLDNPENARPVRSVGGQPGDTVSLADAYPVLMVSTASLAALNQALGDNPVPMDRFRPNIVVDDCEAWEEESFAEASSGTVRFRGATPCVRCIVVTVDQSDGSRAEKVEPLRTLASLGPSVRKAAVFGRNLLPEGEGVIRVGESVHY